MEISPHWQGVFNFNHEFTCFVIEIQNDWARCLGHAKLCSYDMMQPRCFCLTDGKKLVTYERGERSALLGRL